MADLQPGQNIKHLRRDQLLDNYDANAKTLETLVKAKESEVTYRRDLIKMLEESKQAHEIRLAQIKQEYQLIKTNVPITIDIKTIGRLDPNIVNERSTTPPMPPPLSPPMVQLRDSKTQPIQTALTTSTTTATTTMTTQIPLPPISNNHHQLLGPPPIPGIQPVSQLITSPPPPGSSSQHQMWTPGQANNSTTTQSPYNKSSELDLSFQPPPLDNQQNDNRGSLDRRLSEFLKSFPGISQAGVAPPSSIDTTKPPPGYYTQQTSQQQQPPATIPPPPHLINGPLPPMLPQNQPQHHHSGGGGSGGQHNHHHHHHSRR